MALEFMCGAYHFDDAHALLKYDVFADVFVNASNLFMGQPAIDGGLTAYTRPRLVKRTSAAITNTVIAGSRYYVTFPFGGGFTTIAMFASIHRGPGPYSDATRQMTFTMKDDGTLQARKGGYTGTVVAEAIFPMTSATVQMVEFRAVIGSGTSGSVMVVVDNVVAISASGVDTQGLDTSAIGAIEWIPWATWDRYIVSPTGGRYTWLLGKGFHVIPCWMASNSAVQFVAPSGTNVSNIDDTSPDGVSNQSQFVGDTDLFTPTPMDTTYPHVVAAQANIVCERASSGTPASVAPVLQLDGISYPGSDLAVDVALKDKRFIWESSPVDGSDLTVAQLNASHPGYRRTA